MDRGGPRHPSGYPIQPSRCAPALASRTGPVPGRQAQLADTLGANLYMLGRFWMPEGVFMTVAGVAIRLTLSPTDGQRWHTLPHLLWKI